MIREEHLRFDGLCSLNQLINRHCIRLVARQEGNVDILNLCHLGDILGVASNIYAQAIDGQDIAVVTSLRMELGTTLRIVVSRNDLQGDVVTIGHAVAISQSDAITKHVIDGHIGIDGRCRSTNLGYCLALEVITMFVGDEDEVGLRKLPVVGLRLGTDSNGVNLNLNAIVGNLQARMFDTSDFYRLTALCGKLVCLLCGITACSNKTSRHKSNNTPFHHFSFMIIFFPLFK